jgi:hypothetical protein
MMMVVVSVGLGAAVRMQGVVVVVVELLHALEVITHKNKRWHTFTPVTVSQFCTTIRVPGIIVVVVAIMLLFCV